MTLTRIIARPMLASMFVAGGVGALRDSKGHAQAAKPVTDQVVPLAHKLAPQAPIPTNPETLVKINGAAQIAAGLALATGKAPRLASTVLAASLLPTTLAGHRFWEEKDAQTKQNQQIHFLKNVSMLGGLLLAGVDTDGKPGVAWRAKRAARDVRREARQLAKDARRETKLAKAQLT